jgi:hypothetical protein
MANECIPLYRGGDPDLTGHCTTPVTGGTFVALSGTIQSGPDLTTATDGSNFRIATAGAGVSVVGVAAQDAAANKKVAYLRHGNVVPMIADGPITANDPIEVGTAGKPKTRAASGATTAHVGKAHTTAVSGAVVYIEII